MILVPESEVAAKTSSSDDRIADPPPVYVASLPPIRSPPAAPKPMNFVYINRGGQSIKGQFVIDPSLAVPRSLLPPLAADESEEDRKNVEFVSNFCSIDVSISLLGDAPDPNVDNGKSRKRTTLYMNSQHGSINVKLRTCPPPSTAPMPFLLNVTGCHGSINVWLPRTFQGPMTVYSRHGSVKFSDDISERMSLCNEIDHSRRCFLGDLSLLNEEQGGWTGDEVHVKTEHAPVRIKFMDEVEPETPNVKPGGHLLSRILGTIF